MFALVALITPLFSSAGPCYSLYDQQGRLVERSTTPLVDLSLPISAGLAQRHPRHHLVFWIDDSECATLSGDSMSARQSGIATPMQSPIFANARGIRVPEDADLGGLAGGFSSGVGRHAAGTDVRVRSYQRQDGTVVRSHTRAAPGRGR